MKRRLTLNKMSIANLDNLKQKQIKGGVLVIAIDPVGEEPIVGPGSCGCISKYPPKCANGHGSALADTCYLI